MLAKEMWVSLSGWFFQSSPCVEQTAVGGTRDGHTGECWSKHRRATLVPKRVQRFQEYQMLELLTV